MRNFYEFFAGIGLVREGLSKGGWNCLYANDLDRKKREMYGGRFGVDHFHLEDVWNAEAVLDRLPGHADLATASFPCTDLSLAGNCKGLAGKHSSAFFGFVEIVKRLGPDRPGIVMLENVPGFITSKGGADFKSAVTALAGAGYWLDVVVLDAAYFVPQSRKRVFIIGTLDRPASATKVKAGGLKPGGLTELMNSTALPTGWVDLEIPVPSGVAYDLNDFLDADHSEWWAEEATARHRSTLSGKHKAALDGRLASGTAFLGTAFRRKRDGTLRTEVRFDGVAGCLRTPRGGSARQIVVSAKAGELRMRWMSPLEYARLQGAPDFPLVSNEIQNLFGFGDAVCVPVIEHLNEHALSRL